MTVRLVYETHSTTLDNEAGIATGWLPGRLSTAGRANAAALGRRRRDDGLALVVVSDLARAVETVEIAFAGSDVPVHLDPRLRECCYGELDGSPAASLPRGRHVETPFPGGESYRDVVDRTADLLVELANQWDGARVLLVAHSANRWAIEHLLLGRDLGALVAAPFAWQESWEYDLPTGWTPRPSGGRFPGDEGAGTAATRTEGTLHAEGSLLARVRRSAGSPGSGRRGSGPASAG